MENGVSVSTGAVFSQLIRKEGLSDPNTPILEEETILAMANSLIEERTSGHSYHKHKENILLALLNVSDETLGE